MIIITRLSSLEMALLAKKHQIVQKNFHSSVKTYVNKIKNLALLHRYYIPSDIGEYFDSHILLLLFLYIVVFIFISILSFKNACFIYCKFFCQK